jgi:hypothetical protein
VRLAKPLVFTALVTGPVIVPADAFGAAQAWKLVHVKGELQLHVEDTREPCSGGEAPWVASGDYRSVLTSRRAIFGRGHAVYNGSFGSVIGGFQFDFRIRRQATEQVRIAELAYDEDTGGETCRVAERDCAGEATARSKGATGIGFGPRRRGRRLGPVVAEWSGPSPECSLFDELERGSHAVSDFLALWWTVCCRARPVLADQPAPRLAGPGGRAPVAAFCRC